MSLQLFLSYINPKNYFPPRIDINIDKYDDSHDTTKDELINNEGKWIPNDILYKKYNTASTLIGNIKKNQEKINNYNFKIENLQSNIDKRLDKNAVNILDNISDKKDILEYKGEIQILQNKIEEANQHTYVLELWEKYVIEADNYINNNNLNNILTVTDILDSSHLYYKIKQISDNSDLSSIMNLDIDKIEKLNECFDIQNIYINSRGKYHISRYNLDKNKLLDSVKNLKNINDIDNTYMEEIYKTNNKYLE